MMGRKNAAKRMAKDILTTGEINIGTEKLTNNVSPPNGQTSSELFVDR
jgi:hypothetical protein